jgi:hypothetical protein
MSEPLQGSSATWDTIDRQAPSQQSFGDVVGFLAVALKVAERSQETAIVGKRSLVQQPTDQRQVSGRPAGAEQGCRVVQPAIVGRRMQIGTMLSE